MNPSRDVVFVNDLMVDAVIGVYEWERRVPRPLRIDLELETDTRDAAATDSIGRTIDYEIVARRVAEIAGHHPHHLLETLAEDISSAILNEFGCYRLRLTVAKPGAIAGAREVGIRIERDRQNESDPSER
ncbi:MAG: dihydroneopterin aldolase [Thioalkalivibrionaceae bacterium]